MNKNKLNLKKKVKKQYNNNLKIKKKNKKKLQK